MTSVNNKMTPSAVDAMINTQSASDVCVTLSDGCITDGDKDFSAVDKCVAVAE